MDKEKEHIPPTALAGELDQEKEKAKDPADKVEDSTILPEKVVTETFDTSDTRIQNMAAAMKPESRSFLRKMIGEYKERNQNYFDKKEFKNFDKLADRAETKTADLQNQKRATEASVGTLQKQATEEEKRIEDLQAIRKKMNQEIDPDQLVVINSKINQMREQAKEAVHKAQLLQAEIGNVNSTLEEYKAKAEQGRDRISGRFDAKIEKHDQSIQQIEAKRTSLKEDTTKFQESIVDNDKDIQQLQAQIDTGINIGESESMTKQTIKELKAAKKEALNKIKEIQKKDVDLADQIKDYKDEQAKWQKKRDKYVPPAQEKDQPDETQAKAVKSEDRSESTPSAETASTSFRSMDIQTDGTLTMDYDDGATYDFNGQDQQLIITRGNGARQSYNYKDIPSDILNKMKLPLSSLQNLGLELSTINLFESNKDSQEKKEPKYKYTGADLVFGWNKYISDQLAKEPGYKINQNSPDINLEKKVEDFEQARIYLKRIIAKKLTGKPDGRMARKAHKDIENYLVQKDLEPDEIED